MSQESARKRVDELRKTIEHHSYLYYVLDNPEISDSDYDILMKELEKLEAENPDLVTPESPTQRIGGEPLSEFENYKHPFKMYSLANALNDGEFQDFMTRVRKEAPSDGLFSGVTFACEHKFDGLAVELIYEKGMLLTASTRGNGEIGENITRNARTIRSIPLKLSGKYPDWIAVYGEVLMFKEDFVRMNREREEAGEPPFANPRNSAAGSLRQLDPQVTASRKLRFHAYGVHVRPEEKMVNSIDSQFKRMDYLKEIGFPVAQNRILSSDPKEISGYHARWEEERDSLPYDIDGVVIKVDSIPLQEDLGYDTKTPKWAVAWKFKPLRAETVLREVEFSIGRQGTVTPTALFDPVNLSGARITRATLHNFDEVARLDVRIGDTISVERSGEVIPKVVGVVKEKRPPDAKEITVPEVCPVCGSKVVQAGGNVAWRCGNPVCPAVVQGSLRHFVSRNAFDVEGLGEEILARFYELGWVKNFADLFRLKDKKSELISLERFGEKSVENLLAALENSKKLDYWRFVNALGIPNVGEETARLLAGRFQPLEKLLSASAEDLQSVHGIGEVVAESIAAYFSLSGNKSLVEELIQSGVSIIYPREVKPVEGSPISGKKIVFTGKAEGFTRDEFGEIVRKYGGTPTDSVSKNTDLLVVGENAGSKLQKAKELGVKVVSDREFLELLGIG